MIACFNVEISRDTNSCIVRVRTTGYCFYDLSINGVMKKGAQNNYLE